MKIKTLILIALFMVPSAVSTTISAQTNTETYLKWFKPANAKLRTASTYLRTGNIDFAALALEEIIASKPPPGLEGDLSGVVDKAIKQAKSALDLIDANEEVKAREMLLALREMLFQANKVGKIEVFEDCIWVLGKRGQALWIFRKSAPDLTDQTQRKDVAKAVAGYLEQLNKCDGQATPAMKADGGYTRLVDGTKQSLQRIPDQVLVKKDSGLLFRFLIELRSFDRLLYFRFG